MDLFTSKVGAVVVNSADSVVISAFLGLYVLAQYQNYYYIFSSIIGIVEIIYTSCMAGIGNSLITEWIFKSYCLLLLGLQDFVVHVFYVYINHLLQSGLESTCFLTFQL